MPSLANTRSWSSPGAHFWRKVRQIAAVDPQVATAALEQADRKFLRQESLQCSHTELMPAHPVRASGLLPII